MKLALYVHDFRLEVGHSNSLIELIRHLPEESLSKIEEIQVVSCRASPLEELFPNYRGKLRWVKIPLERVRPSILKSVLFQISTILYNKIFQDKDTYRIGIGICSLDVNAISIQFIHHQWTQKGLVLEKNYPIRKLYKKFLFLYYEICENYLFKKENQHLFSPANFLTNYLKKTYPNVNATTIYSGVNLKRFEIKNTSKQEVRTGLAKNHPILNDLILSEPIYLFVGAYERKGIYKALELLQSQPNTQLIVIGSPSLGINTNWPIGIKIFPISFSFQLSEFYSLSDVFIFPTIYEPFGLVLFEAMAMGLSIITNKQDVGASELLNGLPEVYFADEPEFKFPKISVKSYVDKNMLRNERLKILCDVSWEKASLELASIIL